jgi:hypothetical protein
MRVTPLFFFAMRPHYSHGWMFIAPCFPGDIAPQSSVLSKDPPPLSCKPRTKAGYSQHTHSTEVSCRWMFLEEVKIVSGVFDCLLLIGVNRIQGIF